MTRVLITPRSMTAAGPALAELAPMIERGWELVFGPPARMPSEAELLDLVPDVDGWLAGVERIGPSILDAAGRLKVISRNGVGADAIDLVAASDRGIRVELARGANSQGVAELALLLALACLRDLPASNASMHDGTWQRSLGRELCDSTVGIVGFGSIGRLVAAFAGALGAKVLAHDPFASIEPESGAATATLEEVFAVSDVITLHTPPAADARPLVSRQLIGLTKARSILVNTARSSLVDDAAVLEALEEGRLAAYAVDAFEAEPPELTPLLRHPRTVLTPHLGGYTEASMRRASEQAVSHLIATLDASPAG